MLKRFSLSLCVLALPANWSKHGQYQFGCGNSKMLGPKKQEFWHRIGILKRKKFLKIP
jgi:hypothetical protein